MVTVPHNGQVFSPSQDRSPHPWGYGDITYPQSHTTSRPVPSQRDRRDVDLPSSHQALHLLCPTPLKLWLTDSAAYGAGLGQGRVTNQGQVQGFMSLQGPGLILQALVSEFRRGSWSLGSSCHRLQKSLEPWQLRQVCVLPRSRRAQGAVSPAGQPAAHPLSIPAQRSAKDKQPEQTFL
jgi:hypothetical protein